MYLHSYYRYLSNRDNCIIVSIIGDIIITVILYTQFKGFDYDASLSMTSVRYLCMCLSNIIQYILIWIVAFSSIHEAKTRLTWLTLKLVANVIQRKRHWSTCKKTKLRIFFIIVIFPILLLFYLNIWRHIKSFIAVLSKFTYISSFIYIKYMLVTYNVQLNKP